MWTHLFGLSLVEVENQRTTKHPWMLAYLKVTRGVEAIKKIRERALYTT